MIVKVTHPFEEYQAGLIYDMPDEKAKEAIEKEFAAEVKQKEQKKVKHDNWKNNPG